LSARSLHIEEESPVITYYTQFSFARTATDLRDEQVLSCIEDALFLLEHKDVRKPYAYMWNGCHAALVVYGQLMCREMQRRHGVKDPTGPLFKRLMTVWEKQKLNSRRVIPPWMRDKDIVRSHRSHLRRRYPGKDVGAGRPGTGMNEGYGGYPASLWPGCPNNWPVLWPVVDGDDYVLKVARADLGLLETGVLALPGYVQERVENL
jgi:hypothetical protein